MAGATRICKRQGERISLSIPALNLERVFQLVLETAYGELGSQAHLSLYWQLLPLHAQGTGGASPENVLCLLQSPLGEHGPLLILRKMPQTPFILYMLHWEPCTAIQEEGKIMGD